MNRKSHFICPTIEKAITWLVSFSVIVTQLNLLPALGALIWLMLPAKAEAGRLGTSTLSAGSAPPPGAAAVESFQPDLFTGRASTSIPIAIPPGRKGVQPALALSYSSSSRNGWVGMGWGLDLGYIERSTRKGQPNYQETNNFVFLFQGVSSELVKLPDGTFRAKDEGQFLRFELLGNNEGWRVRDKSGMQYIFGTEASSRIASGADVFRWCLDEIKDPQGNSMTVEYMIFDGQPYPRYVLYTANDALGLWEANKVEFVLEDRPDVDFSYRTGFHVRTTKRLTRINTWARVSGAFSLVRRYDLAYRQSQRTGRSILASVRQTGTDATTALPSVAFTYTETNTPSYVITTNNLNAGAVAWNVRSGIADLSGYLPPCSHAVMGPYTSIPYGSPVVVKAGNTTNVGVGTFSVNADGSFSATGNPKAFLHCWTAVFCATNKTVILPAQAGSATLAIYVEDANGLRGGCPSNSYSLARGWSFVHFIADHQSSSFSFQLTSSLVAQVDKMNSTILSEPSLAADVDGNGVSDVITYATGTWRAYSLANGVVPGGRDWLTGFGATNSAPVLGDWNGDGRTDVAIYDSGSWRFATSTGTNFLADTLPSFAFGPGAPYTGDFNGDGVVDLATLDGGDFSVAIGSGTNFAPPRVTYHLAPVGPFQFLTGDFNGDGLTDIALLQTNQTVIYYSDGFFVQINKQTVAPVAGFPTNGVFSVDFNGDGLSDLAYHDRPNGLFMVAYGTGQGFGPPQSVSASLVFGQRTEYDSLQLADFNGDGLPDPVVTRLGSGQMEMALSIGTAPDLLMGIDNGLGASTRLTYQPASQQGNNFVPYSAPVVTETRTSDGMGHTYTNRFTYSAGFYDASAREFRGFGRVQVVDAEGSVATTWFNQDSLLKGRPSQAEFRDATGTLWTRSTNVWEAVQPYPGTDAIVVRPIQSDTFTYDGDATFKQTRNRMAYDAWGNVTTNWFDGDVSITGDERMSVTTYNLNTNAWILGLPALVQSFDAAGTLTAQRRFYYDNAGSTTTPPTKGQLTRQEEWLDRDRSGPADRWIATTMGYNALGNVFTVTDALGHSVTNTYDSENQTFLVQVANPLGHTRTMVYDPRFGAVTSSTDQNGVTTSSEFDALGRVTKTIGPLDSSAFPTTRYEYDLTTVPSRVTQYTRVQSGQSPELVAYSFADGLGRTIQTRSPSEDPAKQIVTGTVEFDTKGRVVKQWVSYLDTTSANYVSSTNIAGLAPPVVHTYDALGRLRTSTDPDGSATSVAYDDWTVTTTDAKGHVKSRTSDAYGHLVTVREFDGTTTNATLYATTTYQYDSRDNLVRLTDTVGNVTSLEYDSLSRKLRMTDPDMGIWTYAYDDVGKLTAQTDARNVSIQFTYDSLNRQTRKDYLIPPASGVPTNQPPVLYTYDNPAKSFAKGKLTEIADASGLSGFEYDTLGRLVTESKSVDATTYTIRRAYDLLGRLTALTYPNNDVAAYTYNAQGGLETTTLTPAGQPAQPIISGVDYNAAGQITRMTYGNGVSSDYSYSPLTLRLERLRSVGPGGVIQDFTYQFDPMGNVSSIADAVHTGSQSFQYDSFNRLTQATGNYYGTPRTFTYAYDQIGNMTGKEGVTQSYGPLNNKPHAVTATSAGLAMTYDANGNMAAKTAPDRIPQQFTFDAENRLLEVTSPTPVRRLDPGWNFVSFPHVSAESYVTDALPGFANQFEQLTRFNTRSNYFESFIKDARFDQFNTVDSSRGYSLYVKDPSGAPFWLGTNAPVPPAPRLLEPGLQLLPAPAETMSASNWLAGLLPGVDYDQVQGWNSETATLTNVATVRPGQAYYVGVLPTTTNLWTPPAAPRLENPYAVRFVYDGGGGRVKKMTWRGTTLFLGQSYEVSPEGQSTVYVFAGGTRVAARESNGSLRWYHTDHLGSANVITDQTGAAVEVTENTPYGSISRREGPVNVAHKFTGQRLDPETGIYFYNARYYDPEIGRFISADTIVPNPNAPQELNRYTYANNNPICYVDPSGHKSFWKKWGTTIAQVVGVALAPFTGGASLALTYSAMAYSGYQAAQAGQFAAWAAGAVVSFAVGGMLGTPNFSNFGMQMAASAVQGAAIGAVSGGISSMAGGGSFGQGMAQGAMGGLGGGLVMGALTSQQYNNMAGGRGFRSDAQAARAYQGGSSTGSGLSPADIDGVAQKYGVPEAVGAQYDPAVPGGTTTPAGVISVGGGAMNSELSLAGVLIHEGKHVNQFRGLKGYLQTEVASEIDASVYTIQKLHTLKVDQQTLSDHQYYLYQKSYQQSMDRISGADLFDEMGKYRRGRGP